MTDPFSRPARPPEPAPWPAEKPVLHGEAMPWPGPQPMPQAMPQPVAQPMPQAMPQPVAQPMPQAMPQPVAQPMPQPVPPQMAPQMAQAYAPPPQAMPQPVAQPVPPQMAPQPAPQPAAVPGLPPDFVTEGDHPVLPVPFSVQIGDTKLQGVGLSVAAAYVAIAGELDPAMRNQRHVANLTVPFEGFSVTLTPEVLIAGSRRPGEMTLQFLDPAGPHLPQLRHILNSFIAGDLVSLRGFLSYTGPTTPKKGSRPAEGRTLKSWIRSGVMATLSLALIGAAGYTLYSRLTTLYETRPVFIEREGREMRATTAGQVVYLNPAARQGEVVFSINSNTGDVLNFQLPCDCQVLVTEGIGEGTTVLPIDVILTFFDSNVAVRVDTLMSVEGLARAMGGDRAYLDVNDGRSIPVTVIPSTATTAASQRGDLYLPVTLVAEEGALTPDDIGKSARLRLARDWFRSSFLNFSQPDEAS